MGVNNIFWHPPPHTHTKWLFIRKGCWAASQTMGKTVSIGTSHRLAMLLSAWHVLLPPFNCFLFFFLFSNVVFVSAVQWRKAAISTHISLPSWASPSLPPLLVTTEHRAELSVMYSSFPLAIYFTDGGVYVSRLLSQFTSPNPAMSTHAFSKSALFLSWKWVHLYHLSRFHISALIDSKHFMTSVQNGWVGERLD